MAMKEAQTQSDILIVDDTLQNLRLLTRMLTAHGYKVRGVPSGAAALRAIHLSPPDLILLDIMMPKMDGFELCRLLKNDDKAKIRDIPVIFISALDEIFDKVKAFKMGGVDYITKPFQIEEVLARVETHLALYTLQNHLEELVIDRTRQLKEALAQQMELTRSYSRFVPREFLGFLGRDSIIEVELGDQVQMKMTILFSDIHSFTTLSEQMTPQDNFNFINDYFRRVGPVIREHKGFIDKYIGDAIMALFPTNADDALQATISMAEAVRRYNEIRLQRGQAPLAIGSSLHTGRVMLGTVGEKERMESTVISDAVNVGARLEGLTRLYDAPIIVSEKIILSLADTARYQFRFLDRVKVKGKTEEIAIFEILIGNTEEVMNLKLESKKYFESGASHYHNQAFKEARKYFQQVMDIHPDDKAAELYLKRINDQSEG